MKYSNLAIDVSSLYCDFFLTKSDCSSEFLCWVDNNYNIAVSMDVVG